MNTFSRNWKFSAGVNRGPIHVWLSHTRPNNTHSSADYSFRGQKTLQNAARLNSVALTSATHKIMEPQNVDPEQARILGGGQPPTSICITCNIDTDSLLLSVDAEISSASTGRRIVNITYIQVNQSEIDWWQVEVDESATFCGTGVHNRHSKCSNNNTASLATEML